MTFGISHQLSELTYLAVCILRTSHAVGLAHCIRTSHAYAVVPVVIVRDQGRHATRLARLDGVMRQAGYSAPVPSHAIPRPRTGWYTQRRISQSASV